MHSTTASLDIRSLFIDLLSDGMVTDKTLESVMAKSRSREQIIQHPLVYIAEQQLSSPQGQTLSLDLLCAWMAKRSDLPFVHIDPLKINASIVTQVMSFAFAKQHDILAVKVNINEVTIACCQPHKTDWVVSLEHVLNKRVKRVFANPLDIKHYISEFYTLLKSISGAVNSSITPSADIGVEALLELGKLQSPDASDQHIVTIVDWLFQYAFQQRASDIHIEPRRREGNVRFRIDGVLHHVCKMPMPALIAVLSRIKTMGRLDIAEKRRPQDGRLKTKTPEGQEVELRLSTVPTAFGEKLVMRIFDPEVLLKSFSELGLANDDFERWRTMTTKPNGIVLVTGPTGSGKTTTLYSTLKGLASPEVNVCTIEDPIEMIENSFNQIQVHPSIDLDFAMGVRSLLRQDPDIIMIGEIRDRETAEVAVQAALTGHLVLSTLHTNDAPSALTRLMEIGLPSYLIRATLLGVMAQRLVRTLCSKCKTQSPINEEQWIALCAPWQQKALHLGYQATGCVECRHTGFKGRQGIYEILTMTDPVQSLISDECNLKKLREQAMQEGMRTLRLSGAQKVAAGLTTIEEVMRVAPIALGY
jgi:general secretion pathway protein E